MAYETGLYGVLSVHEDHFGIHFFSCILSRHFIYHHQLANFALSVEFHINFLCVVFTQSSHHPNWITPFFRMSSISCGFSPPPSILLKIIILQQSPVLIVLANTIRGPPPFFSPQKKNHQAKLRWTMLNYIRCNKN